MSFYRTFAGFYQKASKKMCRECKNFIPKGIKILDLGCGSGISGQCFQDFFQADLTGVDVKDQRVAKIPFQAIDGKNLPFSDNFFNIVLVNYVLHHAQEPIALLREAKRVANDRIIIFEDLPKGLLADFICGVHSVSYSYFFQKDGQEGKFLNEENWKKMFNGLGLKLIYEKKVSHTLNPVKKKMFVLEKA